MYEKGARRRRSGWPSANPPMPPAAPQLLERSCSPASVGVPASAAEIGRSRRGNCLPRLPQHSTLTPIARNGGLDIPENIQIRRVGSCPARLHVHQEDVVKLVFNHGHNHTLQDLDIVAQPDAIKNHIAGLLRSGMTVKQVEEKVFARLSIGKPLSGLVEVT
jgi:hypothetical protein